MTFDPNTGHDHLRLVLASALGIVMTFYLSMPSIAAAALQGAAGGKPNSGGFSRFVEFIDHLADYTIPIGSAFSVLGLVWGGLLFQAGDTRAGRVLGFVALGLGIVLLSKPIAA